MPVSHALSGGHSVESRHEAMAGRDGGGVPSFLPPPAAPFFPPSFFPEYLAVLVVAPKSKWPFFPDVVTGELVGYAVMVGRDDMVGMEVGIGPEYTGALTAFFPPKLRV